MSRFRLLILLTATAACGGSEGSGAPCGFAAMAGPATLLDQFAVPNRTLSVPPSELPARVVVRFAAGPALNGLVGRTDSALVIGVEGTVPTEANPGFGVLVVDDTDRVRGVVVYQGDPIQGAPILGSVQIRDRAVPLLGLAADPAGFETPTCPLFPDTLPQ